MSRKNQMIFSQDKISMTKGLKGPMDQLFALTKKAYLKGMIDNIAKIKINFLVADDLIWLYADPYFKPDKSKLGMVQIQTSKPAKDLIGVCFKVNNANTETEREALIRLFRYYTKRSKTPNKYIESIFLNYTIRLKKLLFKVRYHQLISEKKLNKAKQTNTDLWETLKYRIKRSDIWQITGPKKIKDNIKQTIKLETKEEFNHDLSLPALSENDKPLAFADITIEQGKIISYAVKANINDPQISKLRHNKIEAIDLTLSLDKLDWLKNKTLEAEKNLQRLMKMGEGDTK